MDNQPNINDITDVQQLKALRGDEYQTRENAQAVAQQAAQNIQAVNARIAELESAPKVKAK
jgi:hypothetical protein